MAEILLFHHALGLTPGCRDFADQLRAVGHMVHTPDLYEGTSFVDLDEGVAHAEKVGFDTIVERGRVVAEDLPSELVYMGFSLGVMPAQALAQTRSGAKGAVLMHATVPASAFADAWPSLVPVQIHTMEDDELGDVDVARDLAAEVDAAELFLYPGDRHLFTDDGLPDHDVQAAALVMERVLAFLGEIDGSSPPQSVKG